MRAAAVVLPLLVAVLAACSGGGAPQLEVGDAQSAEPVSGASQIVLEITNHGDGDDALVAVDTDTAIAVEIHLTEIDDGQATMRELEAADLPAGETTRFRPGGLHLMLIGPDESIELGGTFDVTLEFDRSDPVTVPVEVVDLLDLTDPAEDEETVDPDG